MSSLAQVFQAARLVFLIFIAAISISPVALAQICLDSDRTEPALPDRPDILTKASELHFEVGQNLLNTDPEKGLSHLVESYCIAKGEGQMLLAGKASSILARRAFMAGESANALNWIDKAVASHEQSGDQVLLIKALNMSGVINADAGDIAAGIEDFILARNTAAAEDEQPLIAMLDTNIGQVYSQSGRYEIARAHLTDALSYFERTADFEGIVTSNSSLGANELNAGALDDASGYYDSAIEAFYNPEFGENGGLSYSRYTYQLASTLISRGSLRMSVDRNVEALDDLETAKDLAEKIDAKVLKVKAETELAMALMSLERLDEAEAYGLTAMSLAEEINDREGVASVATLLANLYQNKGDFASESAMLRRASDYEERLRDSELAGAVAVTRAELDNNYEESTARQSQVFADARRATIVKNLAIGGVGLLLIIGLIYGIITMRRRLSEYF